MEAALVFLRQYGVARSVNNQRLHAGGNRSLDLLDVVAEEKDSGGLKLKNKSVSNTSHPGLKSANE